MDRNPLSGLRSTGTHSVDVPNAMVDRRGVSNDSVSRYDGTVICDLPQHHIEEVNFLLDGETGGAGVVYGLEVA